MPTDSSNTGKRTKHDHCKIDMTMREAGIQGIHKYLYATMAVGCNYLYMP